MWLGAIAPLVLAACGSSTPPPTAAPLPTAEASAAPTAAPVAEEDQPFGKIPTECTDSQGKMCLPPAKFVKRLCAGFYPDVALSMLGKGTPWQRGYLRVKSVEAWNASGGVSSAEKIVFEEEFVILARREAKTGGIQVSGAGGSYDVLRWDGTCASLMEDEVSLRGSSTPKHAKIPWKSLDDKVRDALAANDKIGKVYADRRKECKGATMGDVTAKCQKADDLLSTVVVEFMRNGGALPAPAKLP
ncbi:Hypothetical protein A7982_11817 [Minicystis rosea]|nr:Hypothetical protein A7982_11817 [Minicystis rosea]